MKELGLQSFVRVRRYRSYKGNYGKVTPNILKRDFKADKILSISAKTGEGLNDLLTSLEEVLREQTIYLNYLFSYQDAGKIQSIRKSGQLLKEAYEEDGIRIEAYVPQELYAKITAQKA